MPTVGRVLIQRSDPTPGAPAPADDRPIRLLGGVVAVAILSAVAVVLTVLDRADRARIERSVIERRTPRRPQPWSRSMAARSIDAPRIPRVVAHPEDTAA